MIKSSSTLGMDHDPLVRKHARWWRNTRRTAIQHRHTSAGTLHSSMGANWRRKQPTKAARGQTGRCATEARVRYNGAHPPHLATRYRANSEMAGYSSRCRNIGHKKEKP